MRKLAPTLIVAALLVATATSFAVEEHLKLEDSPVQKTEITKLFAPSIGEARIKFQLRREEDIELDVADDGGTIVRHAVGSGIFGQASHQFAWDGRNDAGRVVPDGIYHVELQLKDEGRTIEFPTTVSVDSTAPTIEPRLRHQVFSPDGDRRADHVDFHYRFSEPAFAYLYVNGKLNGRSHGRKPVGSYPWYAKGRKPGTYRLALAAKDLAGNQTSTRAFAVVLRFVELTKPRYVTHGPVVRARVSTDAKRVHWSLAGRSGTAKPPKLTLPVPAQKGRYTLTVSANGHRARATVVVRK
ncbi:MAG TPA: FlgD immunoglobulin-like domain containing protein [Gaiellaceae bacterium]|jgi:hypothetical protein